MSSVSGARRGRPGHDQAAVLKVAIELFNRQGYDRTSVGDLARELGLTKSAIYHHVESKEALLSLAVDEALDALEAALDSVTGRTPYERLRAAVHSSVIVLVEHLPAVTLLLRVHGNTPVEEEALRRRRAIDARLAEMVRAAVTQGALRDDLDPQLISRLLFGLVNSLVEWVRPDGSHGHDADGLAAAVTTLAFDGLEA